MKSFLLLLLAPCFLLASGSQKAKVSPDTGPLPKWVTYIDFPKDEVPVKPSQTNNQCLLIDSQENWNEKAHYIHVAVKPLTQRGIEAISTVEVDFDPAYEKAAVHMIRIYREGKFLNKLDTSRVELLQREQDLERNLYQGTQTLVYFLEDVREGDIIEYAYTTVGPHPILSSHYTDIIGLQRSEEIETIYHRLLASSDLHLQIRSINTDYQPKIVDLPGGLREWVWHVTHTPALVHEAGKPSWHFIGSYIELSEYHNWHEFAEKFASLCTLPSDLKQTALPEIKSLVQKWMTQTQDPADRALLALRFVQDEIRYLGFEEGIRAFQPNEPNLIFQRRFGDCKDKSFLLQALLSIMDIPSTLLLVDTKKGKLLPEVLPGPCFNHMVLRIELPDKNVYVDPTWSLQGGNLNTLYFPYYQWGCLLTKETQELTPLPFSSPKQPDEINTTIVLQDEEKATITVQRTFYGDVADFIRRAFTWQGHKAISEYVLNQMQEEYGDLSALNPLEIHEDRENNIITSTESYELYLSDPQQLDIFSHVHGDFLQKMVNLKRTSPFALSYPIWVKEHIHVECPFIHWEPFDEEKNHEHESLTYRFSQKQEEGQADFDIELKHLKDHVPLASVRDYWNIVNRINLRLRLNLED